MGCIWSADNLWPVLSTWVRHAGEADGEVRLVAGRTDPEGVWQYGRVPGQRFIRQLDPEIVHCWPWQERRAGGVPAARLCLWC